MGPGQFLGWIVAVVTAAIGFAIGYYIKNRKIEGEVRKLEEEATQRLNEATQRLNEARTRSMELELESRDKALKILQEAEEDANRRNRELSRQEARLEQRQERVDQRLDGLETRDNRLKESESRLQAREAELENAWQEHLSELERISGMTQAEAMDALLERVEAEARIDSARIIRQVEAEATEHAEEKAREIITTSIQRVAADQVAEMTISSVELPNDEMKGRIIGRGGRNIRTIEQCTGVDLVIDDTPDTVILSCFDPVRREIARLALQRLILDGRIHPGRIESVVEKARAEVHETIREKGEEAALEMGVHGLHPEIIKLLGRLHYRTSYGQNALQHSMETSRLAALMAGELGSDVALAKVSGLLHDLGKAVDHEVDGPHAIIGAEIAERFGVAAPIVNAIGAHHSEMEQLSLEAILVEAADAISSARPGARRESLENYVKRIRALEQVANSFEGVESSFAIQAGREIRIIVKPDEVDDLGAIHLSKAIAKKVEESLQYPGQIKVTVIRETRATELAK